MNNFDGILFTGVGSTTNSRAAGAFRMRTFLEQNNFNIEVIDYFTDFTVDELHTLCDKFISNETLFVGISITFLYDFEKINALFEYVKEKYPQVKTIVGGSEGSIESLNKNFIDKFIWGYSEEAVLHYLNFLKKERSDDLPWFNHDNCEAVNGESLYKNDERDLSILWKDTDLISGNFLPIEISRGCIFKCKFCSFPLLGKKKNDYIRQSDNLVDELRRNYEMFGVNNYFFADDTFNDNVVKLETVAEAIERSGVKISYAAFLRADLIARFPETISMLGDTGLSVANFGIETFHPEAKKAIGKGQDTQRLLDAVRQLKKYKPVYTYTGMIMGLPGEPLSSVFESQDWFIKQNFEVFDSWDWYSLTIRKGVMTRLSEFEREWRQWGYTEMSKEELKNDFYNKDNFNIHTGISNTLMWKNKYTNWFQASIICEKFAQETREHKKKFGLFYGEDTDDDKIITQENKPSIIYEMIGYGFDLEDIIRGRVDRKLLKQKIEETKNNIEKYKKLKLTI